MNRSIRWDVIDPNGRHRDAVSETMQPLLEAAANDLGVEMDELSWDIVVVEKQGTLVEYAERVDKHHGEWYHWGLIEHNGSKFVIVDNTNKVSAWHVSGTKPDHVSVARMWARFAFGASHFPENKQKAKQVSFWHRKPLYTTAEIINDYDSEELSRIM